MKRREPNQAWLPSTEQLMSAPERAILAALDASLLLTIRTLLAEHVGLLPDGRSSGDANYQPFDASLLPAAEDLVTCAKHLHRLIRRYRTALDCLLVDGALDSNARMVPGED